MLNLQLTTATKKILYLFFHSFSSEVIHSIIEYTHLYLRMQARAKRIFMALNTGIREINGKICTLHMS